MKRLAIIVISALLIPVFAAGKDASHSSTVDTIQVLKIAAQDERAVIKTPDGKMQVIKPGDQLGDHGKVTEIAKDRIVIEEKKDKDTEKVIIRLENGKQRIERIKKKPDQPPQLYAPHTSVIKNENQKGREKSSIE